MARVKTRTSETLTGSSYVYLIIVRIAQKTNGAGSKGDSVVQVARRKVIRVNSQGHRANEFCELIPTEKFVLLVFYRCTEGRQRLRAKAVVTFAIL